MKHTAHLLVSMIAILMPVTALAEYCVDCMPAGKDFWCVGAASGARMCRTNDNSCFLYGPCPSPPPPPEPDPGPLAELALNYEMYWHLDGPAILNGLPVVLPSSDGADIASLRTRIAALTQLTADQVKLKAGLFSVGPLQFDADKNAAAPEGMGSMLRIDPRENGTLRVRVCSGPIGTSPVLRSDEILGTDGGVVVVPITIKGVQAVVTYRVTRVLAAVFDGDPMAPQTAFRDDVADHLDPEPWKVGSGEMAAKCE